MPAACSLFFAVVSGQTQVQKIYKELPIAASTITDLYNRLNNVRTTHGLSKYTVPSFSSVKALFSHLTTIHNNIVSTANSIGSGYAFTGTTSQNAKILGLDIAKNEANLGKYLEKKCFHNANNFTSVHAQVFNPSAFQNLSLDTISTPNLANSTREVATSLGKEVDSSLNNQTKTSLNLEKENKENKENNTSNTENNLILKVLNNEIYTNLDRAPQISRLAVTPYGHNGNFTHDNPSFDDCSDSTCWDFSGDDLWHDSGHNSDDFGIFSSVQFGNFSSDDNSDFSSDDNSDFFSNKTSNFTTNFNPNFTNVGAVFNCTRNFSSNCPINYTNYKVEGIDF